MTDPLTGPHAFLPEFAIVVAFVVAIGGVILAWVFGPRSDDDGDGTIKPADTIDDHPFLHRPRK